MSTRGRLSQAAVNKILRDSRRERYLNYMANGWHRVKWIAIDDACRPEHGLVYDITAAEWLNVLKRHKTCRCRFVVLIQEEIK